VSGRAYRETVRIRSKSSQALRDVDHLRSENLLNEGMPVARQLVVVSFLRLLWLASPSESSLNFDLAVQNRRLQLDQSRDLVMVKIDFLDEKSYMRTISPEWYCQRRTNER